MSKESPAARAMALAWADQHAPRGSLTHAALVGQKLGRPVQMPKRFYADWERNRWRAGVLSVPQITISVREGEEVFMLGETKTETHRLIP